MQHLHPTVPLHEQLASALSIKDVPLKPFTVRASWITLRQCVLVELLCVVVTPPSTPINFGGIPWFVLLRKR